MGGTTIIALLKNDGSIVRKRVTALLISDDDHARHWWGTLFVVDAHDSYLALTEMSLEPVQKLVRSLFELALQTHFEPVLVDPHHLELRLER